MAVRYVALCQKVHVCHSISLGGATWRSVMITGRTDGRTDRRTDRVRRNMRPPPREEGRIIIIMLASGCQAVPMHKCGSVGRKQQQIYSSRCVHWRQRRRSTIALRWSMRASMKAASRVVLTMTWRQSWQRTEWRWRRHVVCGSSASNTRTPWRRLVSASI